MRRQPEGERGGCTVKAVPERLSEPTARLEAAMEEARRQQERARSLVAEVRAARLRERESLERARAMARARRRH